MLNKEQTQKIHSELKALIIKLQAFNVKASFISDTTTKLVSSKEEVFLRIITDEIFVHENNYISIQPFVLKHQTDKLFYIFCSKLKVNTTVFARKCLVKSVSKEDAKIFLEKYHLLGNCSSAYQLGLYNSSTLVALATFSKGRKMDRLQEDKRSFELLRFCCLGGTTVTGGLSRLIKHFVLLKNPGDIMTYADKQFGEGKSFLNLGFKLLNQTEGITFYVHTKTLVSITDKAFQELSFQEQLYYTAYKTIGNHKLVLSL